MTCLSFSVKHILALQERCCCRHVRAAHELCTYKQTSDKQLQNQEQTVGVWNTAKRQKRETEGVILHRSFLYQMIIPFPQTRLRHASCSGCHAAVLFHQRWTLSPVMVNALWVEERAVTQGLDRERQNLIYSSFEKTPLLTRRLSAPFP